MGVAVFLSRILGLVREQILFSLFGVGIHTDAYKLAFRIPNLFRDLLAEGALSSAFVSVFSKEKSAQRRSEIFTRCFVVLLITLVVLVLAIALFAPSIVSLLAERFSEVEGKYELTVFLTRLLAPFILFASVASIAMGALNSRGYFFIPALGSSLFNLIGIASGVLAYFVFHEDGQSTKQSIIVFSTGVLVGGFSQILIQLPLLRKEEKPLSFRPLSIFSLSSVKQAFCDPVIKRVVKMIAPATIGVAAMQLNVVITTFFATDLGQNRVSWMDAAYRLIHFPVGLFGVSLFAASLPQFSKLSKNFEELSKRASETMALALILAIGSTAGLIAFGEIILSMIFERGLFTRVDTLAVYEALVGYALGIAFFILVKLCVSIFYAFEDVKTPSLISLFCVGVNFVLAPLLGERYGHMGLALSVSITSASNLILLIVFLKMRSVSIVSREFMQAFGASIAGALVLLSAKYFGYTDRLLEIRDSAGFITSSIYSLVTIFFAGLVYLLSASLIYPKFLKFLFRKLKLRKV